MTTAHPLDKYKLRCIASPNETGYRFVGDAIHFVWREPVSEEERRAWFKDDAAEPDLFVIEIGRETVVAVSCIDLLYGTDLALEVTETVLSAYIREGGDMRSADHLFNWLGAMCGPLTVMSAGDDLTAILKARAEATT